MQFSKERHWLTCATGVAALVGWVIVTAWLSDPGPLQSFEQGRMSSMHRTSGELFFGALAAWVAAFWVAHFLFARRSYGDWLALLFFIAAAIGGTVAVLVGLAIEHRALNGLIPGVLLEDTHFTGALIGWNSGIAASFVLALPGEERSLAPVRAFILGLAALVYIGAEGMAMGQVSAEYNEWHGRMRHVSEWSVPAAFFAYGLLAGWILPFLARWRLKVPARWFALLGVLGIALLVSTGWMISTWPPGTGRWSEPELMSGFSPPFFNGLFIGLALAGFLLARLKPRLPSGEAVPESGTLVRGG